MATSLALRSRSGGASLRARHLVLAGAGAALALGFLRWQLARLFAKQPVYTVTERIGALEVRHYRPLVMAETTVLVASPQRAVQEGFRRLAAYLFGANLGSRPGESSAGEPPTGERLEMTAPVLTTPDDAGHTIGFIMPSGRSIMSLPAPSDVRVRLRSIPGRRVAAMRFRGGAFGERATRHERERALLDAATRAGLRTTGEVILAGYDPPWTLPFLRRQEAWVELA